MCRRPTGALNGVVKLPVRRQREQAIVAGVCAGFAQRWGVDARLLRIAVVILSLSAGLGVILYAAAAALVPLDGSDEEPIRSWLPFTRSWSTAAVVAAVIALAAVTFGILGGWSGVGLLPGLVVLGVWYFGAVRPRRPRPSAPPARTPAAASSRFEEVAEAWRQRLLEQQRLASGATVPPPVPTPATIPPQIHPATELRRGAGRWWWLALTLLGAGAVVLGFTGVGTAPTLAWLSIATIALGITLMVASRRRRPRLMGFVTVLAILATSMAAVLSNGKPLLVGEASSATLTISEIDSLPESISVAVGDRVYDFSKLDLAEDATTSIEVGVGDVTVVLPDQTSWEIDWELGAGSFSGPEGSQDGVGLTGSHSSGPGEPTLRVEVALGAGDLSVRTAP